MSNKQQVNFLVTLFLVPTVAFGVFVGIMNMPAGTHYTTNTQEVSQESELPDWANSREPQPWSKPANHYNNTSYSNSYIKPQSRGEKLADKMIEDFALAKAMGASDEEAAQASLDINNREIIEVRYNQIYGE